MGERKEKKKNAFNAAAKCKEQRQLCPNNVEYGWRELDEDMYSVRDTSILNAPEPQLF